MLTLTLVRTLRSAGKAKSPGTTGAGSSGARPRATSATPAAASSGADPATPATGSGSSTPSTPVRARDKLRQVSRSQFDSSLELFGANLSPLASSAGVDIDADEKAKFRRLLDYGKEDLARQIPQPPPGKYGPNAHALLALLADTSGPIIKSLVTRAKTAEAVRASADAGAPAS